MASLQRYYQNMDRYSRGLPLLARGSALVAGCDMDGGRACVEYGYSAKLGKRSQKPRKVCRKYDPDLLPEKPRRARKARKAPIIVPTVQGPVEITQKELEDYFAEGLGGRQCVDFGYSAKKDKQSGERRKVCRKYNEELPAHRPRGSALVAGRSLRKDSGSYAQRHNPWQDHIKAVSRKYPELKHDRPALLRLASESYRR
jgi:hypothetical protein